MRSPTRTGGGNRTRLSPLTPILKSPQTLDGAVQKLAEQRQGQEAVGDGAAEGRLTGRALRVYMDPLVVAAGARELIHAGLLDYQPIADGDFPPHQLPQSPAPSNDDHEDILLRVTVAFSPRLK